MKYDRTLTSGLAATALLIGAPDVAWSETFVGTTHETRVVVAFAVNPEAAQARIPDGWKLITLGKGPFVGANLIVLLFDQHLILDAEGKPENPASARGIVTVGYAVPEGGGAPRMFVTNVLSTRPDANPYGDATSASIGRYASLDGPPDGATERHERWIARTDAGEDVSLTLKHLVGRPAASDGEAQPYSAADPDFFRIYRYRQLAELVFSDSMGKPLDGELSFSTTAQALAPMFDGSEKAVSAMVLPVYEREIYLP